MVMTRPPAYHPGNFLMKNMNPTNSGLSLVVGKISLVSQNFIPPTFNS